MRNPGHHFLPVEKEERMLIQQVSEETGAASRKFNESIKHVDCLSLCTERWAPTLLFPPATMSELVFPVMAATYWTFFFHFCLMRLAPPAAFQRSRLLTFTGRCWDTAALSSASRPPLLSPAPPSPLLPPPPPPPVAASPLCFRRCHRLQTLPTQGSIQPQRCKPS